MASRRATRSLATLARPSSTASSSLAPPYTHTLPAASRSHSPSPAFQPPYTHAIDAKIPAPGKLAAPYRFSLVQQSSALDARRVESYNTWATAQLSTPEGKERVWRAWVESIIELEKLKSTGGHIPQVSFQALSNHLGSESTLDAIRSTGSVIVRDVVADAEAKAWAKSIIAALELRQSRPTYWHGSLIAARSHTSVLSANNQVLSALTGHGGEALIQADTPQTGIASLGSQITALDSPWTIDHESIAPTTPLLSHLAITSSTPGLLPSSIHAAIYTSLRPLFTSVKSKIGFYDESAYLDPSNWTFRSSPSAYPASDTPTFPHLDGVAVAVPKLNAGDMIFRHSAVPLTTRYTQSEGVFIPTTPLPRISVNEGYVKEQSNAFEQGLPPPHAGGQAGLVQLENSGDVGLIQSNGGRRAMGYDD